MIFVSNPLSNRRNSLNFILYSLYVLLAVQVFKARLNGFKMVVIVLVLVFALFDLT